MTAPAKKWLTCAEAAAYCSVHVQTLREAARERAVAHSRRGRQGHLRFCTDDLDAWMRRVPALRTAQ